LHIKCGYKRCILDIEVTGDVWAGKLACIGVLNLHSKKREIQCFTGESEELVLRTFLQYFNKKRFNLLIGFNLAWDVRYILAKCMQYRLQAESVYKANCLDLMMVLKGFNREPNFNRPGTLNEWSKFLGGQGKLAKDAPIYVLYQMHRWQEITSYNQADLKITLDIWERLNDVIGHGKL